MQGPIVYLAYLEEFIVGRSKMDKIGEEKKKRKRGGGRIPPHSLWPTHSVFRYSAQLKHLIHLRDPTVPKDNSSSYQFAHMEEI